MVAYNKDEKRSREQKTVQERREMVRERERERKSIREVMTVQNVKDHRKMSTKLSFLFISLFSIDCTQ